ncbi:hybrid-cluster NAD(P)-dependent oxidoreductase [Ornithinimicrobium cavernae]|uniref:hybrid-cluster NAD(P)-dependent oxidoreductase n=1 Tax=Ornithinimicrobium cavernae TaxID=2666047 RepID=UPI000D68925C|nr:hybrid-cluster NAD(P)-dependent oxidoreductase [Ornithinimicrobium cavernae]
MTELLRRVSEPALSDDFSGLLTCVGTTQVTHDVRSLEFALPGAAGLRFAPGQYLTLTVPGEEGPLERCYTISSSPAEPHRPTITVKRSGPVSSWLHDHLRVGGTVEASGPFGMFSTTTHPADRYLFLSAGSGITPLMSMTRALRDLGDAADIVFVHCARTPDDIIFRDELDELAARGVAAVTVLCQEDSPRETWQGPRGRLTLPALLTAAPDLLDREVFTCGPPGFMSAVNEHLELVSADPARCHQESFVLDAGTPRAEPAAGAGTTTRQVVFRRSGRTIECDSATTVLAAAAWAGLTVPSSCGEGVCGTCKSLLLCGSVDMQHAGGIRPREIDEGKILLCCSTPLEDLEIDA